MTTDDLEWTLTTKQNVMAAEDIKGIIEAMRETPTVRSFKYISVIFVLLQEQEDERA